MADRSKVKGPDWQRQRKCTAASFNEQNNVLVWNESLRQAGQMLQYWLSTNETGFKSLAYDTRTLTLDVLVHAAFGKSFDFRSSHDHVDQQGSFSYRDALAIVLHNALIILALGQNLLRKLSFVPRLKRISRAADQFKSYMTDMLDENSRIDSGHKVQGNLISSLVHASLHENSLKPEEVVGNIFVFNFAGHDTTAHSFAFTFMLLAGRPEVQDWMAEEIRYVTEGTDRLQDKYELFPRLVRTLAVLVRESILDPHFVMLNRIIAGDLASV